MATFEGLPDAPPFPANLLAAAIEGNKDFPQMLGGIALHMGSAAMDSVQAGELTWDEFVCCEPSAEQLDQYGSVAASYHNQNGINASYLDSSGRVVPVRPKADAPARLFSGADIAGVLDRSKRLVLAATAQYAGRVVRLAAIASIPEPVSYGIKHLPANDRQLLGALEAGRNPQETAALTIMWRLATEGLTSAPATVLSDALKLRLPTAQVHRYYIDSAASETMRRLRPVLVTHVTGHQRIIEDALGRRLPANTIATFVDNVTGLLDNPAQ